MTMEALMTMEGDRTGTRQCRRPTESEIQVEAVVTSQLAVVDVPIEHFVANVEEHRVPVEIESVEWAVFDRANLWRLLQKLKLAL
jgi:hypothetical protein